MVDDFFAVPTAPIATRRASLTDRVAGQAVMEHLLALEQDVPPRSAVSRALCVSPLDERRAAWYRWALGEAAVGRRRGAAVLAVAARYGMTELRVSGSVSRGQNTDSSDGPARARPGGHRPVGPGPLHPGTGGPAAHVPVDVVPDDSVKPRVRTSIDGDLVPL